MSGSRATWSDRSARRLAATALTMVAVLIACGSALPDGPQGLTIDNGTDRNVAVYVNGVLAGHTFAGSDSSILAVELPPLPWHVEVRTSAGPVLAMLDVAPNTLDDTGSVAARADLSCGQLVVFVGEEPSPVLPGPGVPGDCGP